MAHVLGMAAREIGDPVTDLVLMEGDDRTRGALHRWDPCRLSFGRNPTLTP